MCDTQGAGDKAPVVDQKLSIPLRIKSDFQKVLPTRVFYHFLCVSTVNKNLSVIG